MKALPRFPESPEETMTTRRILRIDASARYDDSNSRRLVDHFLSHLRACPTVSDDTLTVRRHDLGEGAPLIDEAWVRGDARNSEQRTERQERALARSRAWIEDIHDSDLLLVGTPIYNFGLPASLKAWIDQVARAGETFDYTEEGPEGLVEETRAIVAVASGGTEVGSRHDYATDHLRHVLGFMGIDDVDVVAADQLLFDDEAFDHARKNLEALAETVSEPSTSSQPAAAPVG